MTRSYFHRQKAVVSASVMEDYKLRNKKGSGRLIQAFASIHIVVDSKYV